MYVAGVRGRSTGAFDRMYVNSCVSIDYLSVLLGASFLLGRRHWVPPSCSSDIRGAIYVPLMRCSIEFIVHYM